MIYFPEYAIIDGGWFINSPYLKCGKWYLHNTEYSLIELGKICKISEDELIILKLKYGG
jgi:hypothetical protein